MWDKTIALKKYPNNIKISKLYLLTLSMWGAETNPFLAVKQGVAKRVRDLADSIQDYQILGRTHQVLPYIPIILSWPDKELAEKYLVKALELDSKDPYNYFFLSEIRFDQGLYDEAEKFIQAGLDLGVRTDFFLEDKRGRWHLKELQKKIANKKGL
jgi:tetratricopeptide (TPR) repeat protein